MTKETKTPTWGYNAKTGEAKLFDTAKLPRGYVDTPAKVGGK